MRGEAGTGRYLFGWLCKGLSLSERFWTRAPRPDPLARCSDLQVVKSGVSSLCRRISLTQKRRGVGERMQGGSVTSPPIFIKFHQRRKRLREGLGSFSLLLLCFRVSELFSGFGVCQQNIYCTSWCISDKIVSPFHSALQPPCLSGRRVC